FVLVRMVLIISILEQAVPLLALLLGTLLAAVFALIFHAEVVMGLTQPKDLNLINANQGVMNSITVETKITTSNEILNGLFTSGGMYGMLGTIWLIICAMVFGGIMDAIGALSKISKTLLNAFDSIFGLFASTVASCLALNVTASDQYL